MKISFIIFLFGCFSASGQSLTNDYIAVASNEQILFTYNTVQELQNDKIINNVFEVKVSEHQRDVMLYANLVFNNGGTNAGIADRLALKLGHKTSINSTENVEVPLSTSPRLLLTQPKIMDNTSYYSFFYDLVLHPSVSNYKPGTYNFSVVFTSTQP